ncbi:MAG: CDP-diacylglycerol--glycerol-3-phosphate 3-phosphatidyltransferase [Actinomycetaceae bacterium]|nr:CDP-diacylglycerol--glycerol-3-phosphate 3-phosphatidyltransferase [Actinomycetaceae bacterium]
MSTSNGGEADAPLFNVANILTIIRLLLVPVFVAVYWQDSPGRAAWAWFVFALAAVTDKADGYLARSRNLITDFGKLADSIADKALISAALIMLSWHGHLWWWVSIVMIGRELVITGMRMTVAKKKVMAAGRGGKIKMVFQSFGIAGLLIPWASFLPSALATALVWISYAFLAIAMYHSLVSAVEYAREASRIARED